MSADSTLRLMRTSLGLLGKLSPGVASEVALRIFTRPKKYERPDWEKKLLESGTPITLKTGLKAHAWGDRRAPIVLLVHGWAGRGTQLGHLIAPLTQAGYQVIALDGPAHGDSPGTRTNINFFANALVDVGMELGYLHGVVAHSFGAGATVIALDRGLKATRVVCVASPSNMQRVVDTYSGLMKLSKPVATEMQKRLEKWAGVQLSDLHIEKISAHQSTPALIVHDPEDREVAYRNAEVLAENWRGARLLTLKNVGHRRILKSKELAQAVLDFMQDGVD